MQACDSDLVVCLDKNRRSLSSGLFNSAKPTRKDRRQNLIISHYDMNDSIQSILEHVYESTNSRIIILFQHPSPATDGANKLALQSVGLDCVTCVLSGSVQSIHFVFDHFEGRNCWTRTSLLQEFLKSCPAIKHQLFVSDERIVAKRDSIRISHPVFGIVSRVGWAHMKKGDEIAFRLESSIIIL